MKPPPTGTGKTGLATAFLTHAIDEGYNGPASSQLWASLVDGIDLSNFVDASVLKSAGMVLRGACLSGNDLRLAQKKIELRTPTENTPYQGKV